MHEIKRATRKRTKTNSAEKKRKNNDHELTFRFPFISNRLDSQIRRSLARKNMNARITHPHPQTLLQLAQPRTKQRECQLRNCPISYINCTTSFVINEITCDVCKDTYIGSTTRPLHDRAKEHIAAAKNKNHTSAVGEHY